jgi:putative PIN family toxin of toxin-antitoxin system
MPSAPASGLRVVLDTNVYVSAFAYPRRPMGEIWRHALRQRYHLLVSPAIISEVGRGLRTVLAWEEARVVARLRLIVKAADVVTPAITLRVIPEDPSDDRILECAVAGRADLIVSGDRHLRKLRRYQNIAIVPPVDFLRMLGHADSPM